MQSTSRSAQLERILTESFDVHEAVRLATAGKGYKPAPRWALCPACGKPVSNRDQVAIHTDAHGKPIAVYHAVCR